MAEVPATQVNGLCFDFGRENPWLFFMYSLLSRSTLVSSLFDITGIPFPDECLGQGALHEKAGGTCVTRLLVTGRY